MLQRFYAQLPEFARPSHPVMRYLLLREGRRITRRSRALWMAGMILLLGLLFIFGWFLATDFGRGAVATSNPLDGIYLVFYWPLIFLQLLARISALNSTVGVIAAEVKHGTWDTLKLTTDGVLLTMRARWATAFYRLWVLLGVLLVLRIVFIGVALINLSSFQGRYLDLLLSGTTPFGPPNVANDVSVIIGTLTIAVMMTAALLAPFTAVAFDAALGMLIGAMSPGRTLGVLGQFGVILLRVLLTAFALWLGAAALALSPLANLGFYFVSGTSVPFLGWFGAFFGTAEGDLGLTLLHLPYVQRLWADHDYGILVGIACLGYVLLQAVLANLLIRWAGQRAVQASRL